MGAQLSLALLVGVGKGALVAQISTLPRGSRDPDVGLHLLLAVHRGLDHLGLVHVVGGDAFAPVRHHLHYTVQSALHS